MRVEAKTFDITDVSFGELVFIARAFFEEAKKSREDGYNATARLEFKRAKMLFEAYGEDYFAGRCQEEIDEITEENE